MSTPIRKIILHTSDTPDHRADVDVVTITKWHTDPPPKGRGWRECGYHYVIKRDGTVQVGRTENGDGFLAAEEMGAHTQGHNRDSVGICWVGRNVMTPDQRRNLLWLLNIIMKQAGLSVNDIYGHNFFNPGKTCPNIDVQEIRDALADGEGARHE